MKTLLLFRHGKSDWGADFDEDHERPINQRGRHSARAMGHFLQLAGQVPDRILTSSAVRARTTVELAAEAGAWEAPMEVDQGLYGASAASLLEVVRATPDHVESLMLVGHEPGFSTLAGRLVGHAVIRLPTAAMARVDLGVSRWDVAEFGDGQLVFLVPPKLFLKGGFTFIDD